MTFTEMTETFIQVVRKHHTLIGLDNTLPYVDRVHSNSEATK